MKEIPVPTKDACLAVMDYIVYNEMEGRIDKTDPYYSAYVSLLDLREKVRDDEAMLTDDANKLQYLVAWCTKNSDHDFYEVFDNEEDAKRKYKYLIASEHIYSANIATITKSTDYDV